jgi:UDPglucose 6-dehydrogenase
MKLGFIGLGKLGLPCAVACTMKGHDVVGYDVDRQLMTKTPRGYLETGPDGVSPFNPCLETSSIRFGSLDEVARHSEIIFVAVQTPHAPRYEGTTRLPEERVDFDYRYLREAIRNLAGVITRDTIVVIISTVLPGTIRREILPLVNRHMRVCYNPFFIAMGSTMRDFLNPEFVLFGVHDEEAVRKAKAFYQTITDAPFFETTIENAELIKVAYNTFIGMKIVFANTLMEICHKTPGTDVDAVTDALKIAHRRLISGSYLGGGMGDGGGCHPRDNIAMSWLARKLTLSCDWFENLMIARERQTEWLADLMCSYDLPKAIVGYAFKPDSNITTGSPALLLKNILEERGHSVYLYDPVAEGRKVCLEHLQPMVFLIGARHRVLADLRFPEGSVVLDPWRCIDVRQTSVKHVPIGIGASSPDAIRFDAEDRPNRSTDGLAGSYGSSAAVDGISPGWKSHTGEAQAGSGES